MVVFDEIEYVLNFDFVGFGDQLCVVVWYVGVCVIEGMIEVVVYVDDGSVWFVDLVDGVCVIVDLFIDVIGFGVLLVCEYDWIDWIDVLLCDCMLVYIEMGISVNKIGLMIDIYCVMDIGFFVSWFEFSGLVCVVVYNVVIIDEMCVWCELLKGCEVVIVMCCLLGCCKQVWIGNMFVLGDVCG